MDPEQTEDPTQQSVAGPEPAASASRPDSKAKPAATPRAGPEGDGRRARRAGLSLAVVLLGGGMGLLVLRAAVDRIRSGPPQPPPRTVVVPTLPPPWTATPSPTLRPTRTPSPTPHTSPSPTPEIEPAILARQQMHDREYVAAIQTWSTVIQQNPEDHLAYYGRAVSSLSLTRGQAERDLFIQYSQAALDDVDLAIELSAEPNGDYYLARAWSFENLGLAAHNRVDRDRLNEIALENLRVGTALFHSDPLASYRPVGLLLRLGRCDEALLEVERLTEERGAGLAASPTLSYYRGVALLCTGRYRQALDALVEAREASADCEYDYQQTVALYQLSRTDEALRKLSTLITGCPAYDGYRYYLRALIRYELGDLAGASEDLLEGALTTWDVRGLKAYVEARMLADEGKPQEALQQMQQAELTFERTRGPFLARIQRELSLLGGQPLAATPLPFPEATPIAALPLDGPTPAPAVRVLYGEGTGPLELAAGTILVLHFRGPADFSYAEAQALAVNLLPVEDSAGPGLDMQLFDPGLQWWEEVEPRWGANEIEVPDRFFDRSGDLFVRLSNPGRTAVTVAEVGLELSVLDDSGTLVKWSFRES